MAVMSSIRGWLGQRSRASRRVDLALAGWVGLCLNSAYLWAFSAPSLGHYAMVALHPGVTREQAQEATGWPLQFAEAIVTTAPPSADELAALRALQAA